MPLHPQGNDSQTSSLQEAYEKQRISEKEHQDRLDKLSAAAKMILECVGEDPNRQGLLDTPIRFANAMLFFTQGYQSDVQHTLNNAVFQEDFNEMVIVKDIDFSSLCEHHVIPFVGKVHIGYIPRGKIIGLSKLPRLVDVFARRLQVQERLTKQIADAVFTSLEPEGVAVVVQASHLCMAMRGVQKAGTTTVTNCMLGCFQSTTEKREEFFRLLGQR